MTRVRLVCKQCGTTVESDLNLPDGVSAPSPNCFTCKGCCPLDNRVKGFIAHDPRLRTGYDDDLQRFRQSCKRPGETRLEPGFQFDRKTPKPIKGPEWAYSDTFLREMLADRTEEKQGRALMLICGRWRQQKTFEELAEELGLTPADTRKALSALRTEGNALWTKKQRNAEKTRKNAELSARAKDLFGRGLTVREVAKIMECSVGYASELGRAA